MSRKAEQYPQQSHAFAKPRFKIRANASRGQKGRKLSSPKNLQRSQDKLKQAEETHQLEKTKERDRLEKGSASN
jgi:hypothetical protein